MERINKCDHTSVGALIYNEQGDLLLFERNTPPWGIAGPAGHCDGDSYEDALKKEVREEVGLRVISYELVSSFTVYKGCRRPYDGSPYHVWQFFRTKVAGTVVPSARETRNVSWYSTSEIKELMQLTARSYQRDIISASSCLDTSWYSLFQQHPELLEIGSHNARYL